MKRCIVYTLFLSMLLLAASTLLWALRPPKTIIWRDGRIVQVKYNRDMQRITVRKHFARARGKDTDGPVKAEAQVDCEKDDWWELQRPGIQYKAWSTIVGDAPADYQVYGGVYSVYANALMDSDTDKSGVKWQGIARDKAKADYKIGHQDGFRYFDGLSDTGATGWITGGSPGALTPANESTAAAGQFSYNSTYDWDCGKCWGYREVFDENSDTMQPCPWCN